MSSVYSLAGGERWVSVALEEVCVNFGLFMDLHFLRENQRV